ncbi:MAG: hypothetical protein COA45_06920 [Zetaproteobacteria bacterium]|nr:MAG: hypothetical protein COA45_06920 [Zetaproteobacteria bacterium]
MGSRPLTAGEIAIAQTIYGDQINYNDVRIHDEKHNFLQGDNDVVTPNGEIYYPDGLHQDDISEGTDSEKAILIHELGHVLQEQKGMSIILQRILDGSDYNYDPIFHGTPFHELPMEAQAEFLEDLYRKRNGIPLRENKGSGGALEDADRDLSEYEAEVPMLLPNGNPNGDSLDDLAEPYIPLPPIALPQTMGDLLNDWGVAKGTSSPLVLDLDGQGIDLASVLGTGAVYWDIDQDGFGEKSGWISGNDGLLAIDLNADGVINDHGELFGTDTTDGFTVLSAYDSNSDNVIDLNDTQFGDLLVWVDANADGYSQSGELFSLTDLGITSINLNASLVDYDIAGNHVTHESTFTINGQTQTIVDAWFAYDNVNSHYQGSYTLDVRTLYLPTLRGFGDVKDLHIAMSMDETLLLMVQEVAISDQTTLFSSTFDLFGKMEAIMYRWAGVDGVDPTSRGSVNAQQLEFIETYLGDDYVYSGDGNLNPTGAGVTLVHDLFDSTLSQLAFSIIAQTDAASYLGDGASYNFATGQVEGTDLGMLRLIEQGQGNVGSSDYDEAFVVTGQTGDIVISDTGGVESIWLSGVLATDVRLEYVGGYYDLLIHTDNGTITVEDQFKSNKTGNNTYDVNKIETLILGDGTAIDLINNLTFTGTSAGEYIYGLAGGNDTLVGGLGNDYLYGDTGNDTYVYNLGDGNDIIVDFGGVDQISFGAGITVDDVRLWKNGNDLELYVGSDKIKLDDQFRVSNSNKIETATFEDGSTLDLLNNLTFTGTSSGEYIYGLVGGNETLVGGLGNDYLYGDTGNDTYVYNLGDGNDVIVDYGGIDQISFGAGITVDDVRLWKNGNDLELYVGSNKIKLDDQFRTSNDRKIETATFEDGSTLDLLNDLTFTGTSSGEYIYGLVGGNETLVGGLGNDYLYGDTGNDTYIYNLGDGSDDIVDYGGIDQISFGVGITVNDVRLWKDGNDLELYIGTDKIKLDDQFRTSNDRKIETATFEDGSTLDLLNGLAFTGTSASDYIIGTAAGETIYGEGGSDYLYGGSGDDVLYGGAGVDMVYGQAGADTFAFESSSAFTASDNIQDFNLSEGDKLDISDLLIGYDALTDLITDFVQITESGSHSYLSVDADGGADNFIQVAYIYNEIGLTDEEALETSGNLITV